MLSRRDARYGEDKSGCLGGQGSTLRGWAVRRKDERKKQPWVGQEQG